MTVCVKCGIIHHMVIEDREGNQKPIDMCYDCIFSGCRFEPPKEPIELDVEEYKRKFEKI